MGVIISAYLFFLFVTTVLYKITDLDKPNSELRDSVSNDFIYKLLDCQFCIESHLGFCIFSPLTFSMFKMWHNIGYDVSFFYNNIHLFFLGWICSAINLLVKKILQ